MQLAYGRQQLSFAIDDKRLGQVLQPRPVTAIDPATETRRVIHQPVDGTPPLAERVKATDKVVIIVSDVTRGWIPTAAILPVLVEELSRCGIKDEQITVLVATGSHRLATGEELRHLVGPQLYSRLRVINHNCHCAHDLVKIGHSRAGTPIYLNRHYVEADCRILTGGITYHFMTGFSGGRKSLVPGIAGYETIQSNHRLLLTTEDRSRYGCGKTAGNPLHEDMMEIAAQMPPTFLVNAVPGLNGTTAAIVAGNWDSAWETGTRLVADYYGLPLNERGEIVIASSGGYPLDINLYQAVKALINAHEAVTSTGGLLLAAQCSDGTGAEEFARWLEYPDAAAMEAALLQEFTVPGFIAYCMRAIAEEHPVALVSDLPRDIATRTGMVPQPSIDAALAWLDKQAKSNAPVHVLPRGNITLPLPG